ncbi:MAG: hypothetical protein ACP5N7_00835 [Candidatus Pacearchaeota archaeon]
MEFFITQPFDKKNNLHYFQKFENACEFVLSEMKNKTKIKDNKVLDYKITVVDNTHWIGTFVLEDEIIIDSTLPYNKYELGYYPILKVETED